MNRRWAILLLALVVLVVLAHPSVGAYLQGGAHDCPPTQSVDRAQSEDVDDPPVEFADLSEQRQREFERAVGGDHPEVESTARAWTDTRFVRYRGVNYSRAVAVC